MPNLLLGAALGLATLGSCLPQSRVNYDFGTSDLCTQRLTKDLWNSRVVSARLTRDDRLAIGKDDLPFEEGFQTYLLGKVKGANAAGYTCTFERECVIATLSAHCNDEPYAASILKAMANWSNFYQRVDAQMARAVSNLQGQAASMPGTFNPSPEPADDSAMDKLELGIGVAQFLLGMAPLFPQLKPAEGIFGGLSDSIGFAGEIIGKSLESGGPSELESFKAEYDAFADISKSAEEIQKSANKVLSNLVRNQLESQRPYDEAGGLVSQIINGDFADAVPDFTDEQKQSFEATLAAPAINGLWNRQQVIVARFSQALLGEYFDNSNPCEGENVFPYFGKFCDSEGHAYVLRTLPRTDPDNGNHDPTIEGQAAYQVPGFDNLGDFSLNNMQAITQSAWNNQQQSKKYLGAPPSSGDQGRIQQLADLARNKNIQVQDTVFFNMPVCDLDPIKPTDRTLEGCSALGTAAEAQICIINKLILCGCGNQRLNGQQFPYQSSLHFTQCEVDDIK